jgi:hypothetical protein
VDSGTLAGRYELSEQIRFAQISDSHHLPLEPEFIDAIGHAAALAAAGSGL